jgi:hypothetical protein
VGTGLRSFTAFAIRRRHGERGHPPRRVPTLQTNS